MDHTNPASKKFIPSQIQQLLLNPQPHTNSLHNIPTTSSSIIPQKPMSAPGPSLNIDGNNLHNLAHVAATFSSTQNHIPQIPIRFAHEPEEEEEPGGHDSPNWSKIKSG